MAHESQILHQTHATHNILLSHEIQETQGFTFVPRYGARDRVYAETKLASMALDGRLPGETMPRRRRYGRVGRPRQSGCFAAHTPGVECPECRRCRQRRWRQGSPEAERNRQRERTEEEQLVDRARAYVWTYIRRGKLILPAVCEKCGLPSKLGFWHPRPAEKKEVLWLCAQDRRRVAATGETVTLAWVWPGGAPISANPPRVTPNRRPRGIARLERRQAADARRMETVITPSPCPGVVAIDPEAALERLEAAAQNADAAVARVWATIAAYDAARKAPTYTAATTADE
jgi:hypothetical protein